MRQNIAINFFSFILRTTQEAESGLPVMTVEEKDFVLEENLGHFSGFQTNEAPLANMVDLLTRDGEKITRLYCLVTPQCVPPSMGGVAYRVVVVENGVRSVYPSQFDFWCARMRRLRSALADAEIIPILLCYREDALIEDIEGQVADLTERIKGDAGGASVWRDCHIYADITGGSRYANMMMTTVLQFLQYDGMQVEKMLYADFHTLSRENRIFDVRAASDAYKLVAGADAFVSLGSSRAIEEYFGYDAETGVAGKVIGDELRGVLAAMHEFSDAIQICRTANIPRALSALSASLEQFLDLPEEERTVEDRMFMQLIDTITEGYGALLGETDDESERYPAIIRWCMEKGLLQQAMTLATEWLPVCFVKRRIVYPLPILTSCAKAAVSRMHPGWMQNFIINPTLYWKVIQERKKKKNPVILQLDIEHCVFKQGDPNDSEVRWAAFQDTWRQMKDHARVVLTDCGKKDMFACLRTHFYLREQRNLVNHATAEDVCRKDIEKLLNDALTALSAATSKLHEKEG